jgi:hypothetical protein
MKVRGAHFTLSEEKPLMTQDSLVNFIPWDAAVFGVDVGELTEYSLNAVHHALKKTGHYIIRVNPLSNKKLLHENGFYYCDTLIEPSCDSLRLRKFHNPDVSISKMISAREVIEICHGAFVHDRFHRDFNIQKNLADIRYDRWIKQLLDDEKIYGLFYKDQLAGFIGHNDAKLVLHAVSPQFRGKGLAKYWWYAVSNEILESGNNLVKSSISASNLPVVNLYASLGFLFGNAQDIYHLKVR